MKRYDPLTPPPPAPETLAPPTMARDRHFLFHSQNGDICGTYGGQPAGKPPEDDSLPLTGNILIVAQCPMLRVAKAILANVQRTGPGSPGFTRAAIVAWLKGEKQKSMWAVVIPDVTPADVEMARPFFPATKPSTTEKRVSLTGNKVEGRASKVEGAQRTSAVSAARTAGPSSAARPSSPASPTLADKVRAMPVTTFAFLLESDDLTAAADAQRSFADHLAATQFTGDWRQEWSRWHAANPTPAKPAAPVMPVMPVLAKPHPLPRRDSILPIDPPRRDSILPIDPLAALRRLATK